MVNSPVTESNNPVGETFSQINEINGHITQERQEDPTTEQEPSTDSVISTTERKASDHSEVFEEKPWSNSTSANSTTKRPHSATYPIKTALTKTSSILRPKTAIDSSNKAVRFADDENKTKSAPGGRGKEPVKKEAFREKGNKGKSSCRPFSSDSGFDDKDDHGDGNGNKGQRGSGGQTFMTQESARPNGPGEGTSSVMTSSCSQQEGRSNKANLKKDASVHDKILKNAFSSNTKNSSSSSQTIDLHSKADQPPCKETNNNLPRDTTVRASIIYDDVSNQILKSEKPKLRGMLKTPDRILKLERKVITTEKKNDGFDKKLQLPQHDLNPRNEAKDADTISNSNFKVEGERINSKDVNEFLIQNAYQQNYSYDRYSRLPPEKQNTPSARRAKAYQNLIKKTKNKFPSSFDRYDDCSTKSWSKNTRPNTASASSFNERSKIQSKHGLLKTRPSSTSALSQKNRLTKQNPKKAQSKSETKIKGKENILMAWKENDDGENTFRPKSASKVTFADDAKCQYLITKPESAHSSMRLSHKKHCQAAFGSCDSLKTQETNYSTSDNGIFGADFNRMWDEIPNFDSDNEEDENDNEDNEDAAFSDGKEESVLLSKFEDLDAQFELLKSEMAEEKARLMTKFPVPERNISPDTKTQVDKTETAHFDSSVTIGHDLSNVIDDDGTPTDDIVKRSSIFVTADEEHISTENLSHFPDENNQANLLFPESYNSRNITTTISTQLYKKTSCYVEVSKRLHSSTRRQNSHSTYLNSKAKALKCVPIEAAGLSHADERPDSSSSLLNLDDKDSRQPSPSGREKTSSSKIKPISKCQESLEKTRTMSKDTKNGKFSRRKHSETKLVRPGSATSIARGTVCKTATINIDLSFVPAAENSSQRSSNTTTGRSPSVQSDQSKRENQNSSVCSNYNDILLAYRQHCMEDSEEEEEEVDIVPLEENELENLNKVENSEIYLDSQAKPHGNNKVIIDGKDTENISHDGGITNDERKNDGAGTDEMGSEKDSSLSETPVNCEAQGKEEKNKGKTEESDKGKKDEKAKSRTNENETMGSSEEKLVHLEVVAKPKIISKSRYGNTA